MMQNNIYTMITIYSRITKSVHKVCATETVAIAIRKALRFKSHLLLCVRLRSHNQKTPPKKVYTQIEIFKYGRSRKASK